MGKFDHEPNDGCHYFHIVAERDANRAQLAHDTLDEQINSLMECAKQNYRGRQFYLKVQHDVPQKVLRATVKIC